MAANPTPSALAVAAHPDDIEFGMAGTLLRLRDVGWKIHYLNLSSGNLGSMAMTATQTASVRRKEAQVAAKSLGAVWHAPMCHDLQIFYNDRTLRRLCAVIRAVAPQIILTHSLHDYMEDHTNTARLTVTAAFAREMPNYRCSPPRPGISGPVTIYHAQPHGHTDGMRQPIIPELLIDTTSVHARKQAALACHMSQKSWLDATQGMNSYIATMDDLSREIARLAGSWEFAEGWRRHQHLGFCGEDDDPLRTALGGASPKRRKT